jgi:hypothetical protein
MAFVRNQRQQISMGDTTNGMTERNKKMMKKSWAEGFSQNIFPRINEDRFSVLYSGNAASRPNTPVNVILGLLLLKEMFTSTDEECMQSLIFDIRYQHALHTTSYEEQPISDRTISRFRERLYWYEKETGIDLMKEEMEALANEFVKFMKINPVMKRMDSLMIASSCRKMGRMEILYRCVSDMAKVLNATGEAGLLKGRLMRYLDPEDENRTLYRTTSEQTASRLDEIIADAFNLLKTAGEGYSDLQEYKMLDRVIGDQIDETLEGITLRPKKEISSTSLQNPSDEDATFRIKSGEKNKGYVGNIVETFDEQGSIITGMDYEQNIHSDIEFCKTVIEAEPVHEEPLTMVADGAYGSEQTVDLAKEKNITLITTALIGKSPDPLLSEFVINEATHVIESCPAGEKPTDNNYRATTDCHSSHFNKSICMECPNRRRCGVIFQKKRAIIRITGNQIKRASYLKRMSEPEYKRIANLRNAVEGIPSLMRRKYRIDEMPVRGYLRSKCWFFLKAGAINVKRVLAYTSSNVICAIFNNVFYHFQFSRFSFLIFSKPRGFASI